MLISTAFFASLVAVGVGLLIFWANPLRRVNRVVCTCSLHAAAWLWGWHMGSVSENGLYWFRWTCAVGGLVPLHLWIVKEAIAGGLARFDAALLRRAAPWAITALALAIVPFTEFFIPASSTAARPIYGLGYYGYIAVDLGMYGFLLRDTFKNMQTVSGGQKLELQLWLGGGCAAAGAILLRMALTAITKDPTYGRIQPLIIIVFYAVTAFAITTHRIFDARQIMRIGLQRLTLVGLVTALAYWLDRGLMLFLPQTAALVATTAACLWVAATLNGWLDRIFQFYPQATAARQAAFATAQRETRVDKLEIAFNALLKGWGQSDRALILSGTKGALSGNGVELPEGSLVTRAMRQLRWATPERLARERPTVERAELAQFLKDHGLGVLAIGEGPTLTTIVGVGVAASRRPFTYPQVTQLIELASIIEGALERAHFSAKVQHTEQLATVGLLGASLAHEIRNPLVSIKTFVQLLPTHHQDAAFRDKFFRLISDEVGRIDQLTEQLLDLASPRTYTAQLIDLHPVLRASLDLVAAKAAHKRVQFMTDFGAAPDRAFTDASAAKQVMLNLCFNAIQAVEAKDDEQRWVKIATRNIDGGIEMAVADSGPGIAPEMRPRLFQPFQTTKSTGFGLGLAICSDILANLNASISVDPPAPGQGATFRVIFPCQPSSS